MLDKLAWTLVVCGISLTGLWLLQVALWKEIMALAKEERLLAVLALIVVQGASTYGVCRLLSVIVGGIWNDWRE